MVSKPYNPSYKATTPTNSVSTQIFHNHLRKSGNWHVISALYNSADYLQYKT